MLIFYWSILHIVLQVKHRGGMCDAGIFTAEGPGLQIMWRLGKVKRKMCYSAPELSCPSFSLQFKQDSLHIQMRTSHLEFLCFLRLSNYIEDCWIPSKVNALRLIYRGKTVS